MGHRSDAQQPVELLKHTISTGVQMPDDLVGDSAPLVYLLRHQRDPGRGAAKVLGYFFDSSEWT